MSTTFYRIRHKSDGLFFSPQWGNTGFKRTGKTYSKRPHALSAWKNAYDKHRRQPCELVTYEAAEMSAEALT